MFPSSVPHSVPKDKRHHPVPRVSLRNIAADQDLRGPRPFSSGREISSREEVGRETSSKSGQGLIFVWLLQKLIPRPDGVTVIYFKDDSRRH